MKHDVVIASLWRSNPEFLAAWIAAALFMVATQLVARELVFGVEFVCALALFSSSAVLRRWVVPVAVLLSVLLAFRSGLLPPLVLH